MVNLLGNYTIIIIVEPCVPNIVQYLSLFPTEKKTRIDRLNIYYFEYFIALCTVYYRFNKLSINLKKLYISLLLLYLLPLPIHAYCCCFPHVVTM